MKIKDFGGDRLLMTILAIIALLMLSIRIVYTTSNKEKISVPELPKTTIPSPVPTSSNADFEKKFPLWQLLPYAGDGFVIEKYTEPLVLKVSLKKGDKIVIVEKIIAWIEKNGVDPETHKIIWE